MTIALLLAVLSLPVPARAQTDAPAASTVTLHQVYDWALARSEDLKSSQEDVEQSRLQARAAMAGLFPKLDWELVDTWQDPAGVRKLDALGFSGFVQKEQQESRLVARQPLFSGFKEFSAYSGFKDQTERDRLLLERARRELFETVAASFYDVLDREAAAANAAEGLKLAQDRVKDLRGFLKLGKARDSEVFTAQARAAALKAGLRRAQADIASAREELSFLAGRDLSAAPLADDLGEQPELGTLPAALARASERSDVRARREDVAAAEKRVRYERGSYWPSIDLTGKYYTRRATFMKEINWDVTLNATVPIFQGGRTSADVDRASSGLRQARLRLEQLDRMIAYQVKRLHGEFTSSIEEAQAQDEAAAAAQKSYDALREEYTLGLVTNLDVLQALDLLLSERRQRDAARLDVRRRLVSLGTATEALP
jgi:outer membrane protein